MLKAEIDGPRGTFEVYTTHLNWRYDQSDVRQLQVQALAEMVGESDGRTYPPIVCGDLNADPIADEIRMLTGRAAVPVPRLVFVDAWDVAGEGPGYTWSNDNPFAALDLEQNRRIDYVLRRLAQGPGRRARRRRRGRGCRPGRRRAPVRPLRRARGVEVLMETREIVDRLRVTPGRGPPRRARPG